MLKALTLYQPWASLIAGNFKLIETRGYEPEGLVLPSLLAIHAGKQSDSWFRGDSDVLRCLGFDELPAGAVVAVGLVYAVVPTEELVDEISRLEDHFGDFSPGRFGWRLSHPVFALPEPVPCTGHQKIWTLPRDVEAKVMEQYSEWRP